MAEIGFIGGGNMAEALIRGIIEGGVCQAKDIMVSDVRSERLDQLGRRYGVNTSDDNAEVARQSLTLILAVKPQVMGQVLEGIKDEVRADALVISIAAGICTEKVTESLGDLAVIRVMPNTPALAQAGASGIYATPGARGLLDKAKQIFSAVGAAVIIDDEELMDAVTAVSGSGPAYFFLLMEAMTAAGAKLGLDEGLARSLSIATAKGAAVLAREQARDGVEPGELRRRVTSPGGTTEAALKVFEQEGFAQMVLKAITAARDRGRELSRG